MLRGSIVGRRVFAYVNKVHKRVRIHMEMNGPCSDLLKQILSENAEVENLLRASGDRLNRGIIEFAYVNTGTGFWLIVYCEDMDDCRAKIEKYLESNNVRVDNISFCEKCSCDHV